MTNLLQPRPHKSCLMATTLSELRREVARNTQKVQEAIHNLNKILSETQALLQSDIDNDPEKDNFYISVLAAAKTAGVSKQTIYKYADVIGYSMSGNKKVIKMSDLKKWLAQSKYGFK